MRLRRWLQTAMIGSLLTWLGGQALAPAGPLQSDLHPIALIGPQQESPAHSLVLGAWQNGKWLKTGAIVQQLNRPLNWQVQSLSGGSTVVRSLPPLHIGEAPCEDTGFLRFSGPGGGRGYRLATSPSLRTRPRRVESLAPGSATYREIVRAELLRRGIARPVVNVTSMTRADLDGNGTQEVIVAASHFRDGSGFLPRTPPPHAGAGDYSLLLLRWVRAGQVQTTVLGESFFARDEQGDEWQMPSLYELAGIADLNGDGRMELVVTDSYYEGSGAAVLEWTPAGGPKERLSAGCGA